MRRCTPVLVLVLSCGKVGPAATVQPAGAPAPAVEAVQVVGPAMCPEPHVGKRLQVLPELRTVRVDAWAGVPALRPAGVQPDLPGVVTGLLWSIAYANGAEDCRTATGVHAGYHFAGGHDHALYFLSRGEGDNFLRDWQVPLPDGTIARYDAAVFGPRTGAQCLRACAHLATVEVNGGRGGRGLHFVATAVTVVDERAPLAIPDVLEDLRARFAAGGRDEERALQRLYDDAKGQLPAIAVGRRIDGPIRVEPIWLADTDTLEVLVWRDAQAVGERRTGSETVPPANCPPGAPCAYRDVGTFDLFETATIRSEVAARYRVDRDGVLVEQTLYAPRVQASSSSSRRRR